MNTPEDVVREVASLVSLPEVAVRINSMAEDPKSTAEDLGRLIMQDAALTGRLLRVANSAAFGQARQVETISRAVVVLGTRQVRDIAMTLYAARAFDGIPNRLVSVESFWHHSVLCAIAARLTASAVPRAKPETSFIAGLLHDIGQLVLFHQRANEEKEALLLAVDGPGEPDLHLCEKELLGFDHAAVGGALAREWKLPTRLQECIEFHHQPERAVEFPLDVAIVHMANSFAVLAEIESTDLADAPPIATMAWEVTGLDRGLVPQIAAEARAAADEVKKLFQLPH
jgi:putative nucleotidyltransferase with HDIG domain